MSLNCLAITLTAGVILKTKKKYPLLRARDSCGGILGDSLGGGNCESRDNGETVLSEEDKRATTNVHNGLVFSFYYLFVSLNSNSRETLNSKRKSWRKSSDKL